MPPLTTRDALAKALASTWIDGPRGRRLIRAEYGEAACEDFADALLASGALIDATKLAEDEALIEAMAPRTRRLAHLGADRPGSPRRCPVGPERLARCRPSAAT